MATTNTAGYMAHNNMFRNDIWSQKARHRMNTARARRSITFIKSMSAEATAALQQLQTDESHPSSEKLKPTISDTGPIHSMPKEDKSNPRTVSLSTAFERLNHKMEGDITDPLTWENDTKRTKFVLGGGKLQNAMEIIEIVNADDTKPPVNETTEAEDERAITEVARINSINKCNVWFEAHEEFMENPSLTHDCESL